MGLTANLQTIQGKALRDHEDESPHLLENADVPGSLLFALHGLCHLILVKPYEFGTHFIHIFTDGETEAANPHRPSRAPGWPPSPPRCVQPPPSTSFRRVLGFSCGGFPGAETNRPSRFAPQPLTRLGLPGRQASPLEMVPPHRLFAAGLSC